ncbi:hypothetical protein QFC19_004791 [Naganishia cerealis]|uniref:Uncharacterized protein n=1 Tax=Naganishia cerealis TaxID=610337 RepID=A0ACC2VSZ7_9TREE|nr:hypothetical protein QFC19_004791 [Naganishia cerealis]
MLSVYSLLALLLAFGSPALAQIFTTTYPWAEGDTVVLSQYRCVFTPPEQIKGRSIGLANSPCFVYSAFELDSPSCRSIVSTGRVAATTPLVPGVPAVTTARTTTSPTATTTGRPRTTRPAVVQYTTSLDTSTSTSWYWYTSNGVEYSTYFSPTFTTISSATPAPSGSIQDYTEYMSSVNLVASSAYANLASGAVGRGDSLAASVAAWALSFTAIGLGALAIL